MWKKADKIPRTGDRLIVITSDLLLGHKRISIAYFYKTKNQKGYFYELDEEGLIIPLKGVERWIEESTLIESSLGETR